tara:strand:+ start:18804 stop:19130 length:327 start_codon:yes stop_codon:yes gene_type:complete
MRLTKYDLPHHTRKRWYEIAASNGISKGLFYNRLQLGWTEREAATKEKQKHAPKPPKQKSEITELAEKSGFSYSTIYTRLKRGWSVKDATTKPPMKKTFKGKREVEHG